MSEPPKLWEGDQRTWILEVDCFPLLRPGNVERKKECWRWRRFWVRRGSEIHMVWKGGGWINCMMKRSPASTLTQTLKCWKKRRRSPCFSPWRSPPFSPISLVEEVKMIIKVGIDFKIKVVFPPWVSEAHWILI